VFAVVEGLRARTLALLVALLAASLTSAVPALALSQRGHVFSFAFGAAGKGAGRFTAPDGIAVSSSTGDVYVSDRAHKFVEEFEPVLENGVLANENYVREFEVPYASSIAVDNSGEGSDPSQGDVYVVGGKLANNLYKFNANGEQIGEPLKRFGKTKFEPIDGIAVDSSGAVFVYQENGAIDAFSDAVANAPVSTVQAAFTTGENGQPGFAVDSTDDFYADAESRGEEEQDRAIEEGRTGPLATAAKLEGATGKVLLAPLDGEDTTALAVNPLEVTSNGVDERDDVYADNVTSFAGQDVTTVAQFSPDGSLIQRFGAPELKLGDAIAVEPHSGDVYVADAVSEKVDVFTLEPPGPPTVERLSSQTLPSTETTPNVKLSAQVNPVGAATSYRFEYGTARCTEVACTATPSTPAGESFDDQAVSAELASLPPGTYYFRVVAESAKGKVASGEQTFTIMGLLSALPADGRGWELVSPPDKDGAEPDSLTGEGGVIQASQDGGAITYVADGPMPASGETEGSRSPEPTQVLSTRGAEGWTSTDITTPNGKATGVPSGLPPEYQAFSPNLALGLVEPFAGSASSAPLEEPPLSPPISKGEIEKATEEKGYLEPTMYLRDDQPLTPEAPEQESYAAAQKHGEEMENPGFLALVTGANAPGGDAFGGGIKEGVEFAGATPDLRHVVFESYRDKPGLYEWGVGEKEPKPATAKELEPVSVLPGGSEETPVSGAWLGGPGGRDARNAISNDGSLVVWTAAGHLYLRYTGASQPRETIQLDTVQPGASGQGTENAVFQTAGEEEREGSRVFKVFFTDVQRLTPGARAGEVKHQEEPDLYVSEVRTAGALTPTLTDLTPEGIDRRDGDVVVGGNGESAGAGVIGASEDGSYVYFVANGALAPNAVRGHCGEGAQFAGGECNLYVRHDNGTEWTPAKLIAALSNEDRPDWGANGVGSGDLGTMTSRVSPDGNYLAFMSDRSLTGYDNEDQSSKAPGERLDEEVYLYDAGGERLVCASCNPTGARPAGVYDAGFSVGKESGEGVGLVVDRAELWGPQTGPGGVPEPDQTDHWLAGSIPGWTALALERSRYQSRYLSDEGRLFFNGADALVHLARPTRNEEVEGKEQQVGVENVYEYEPNVVGGCHSEGGCVGLISSGTSEHESAFLDASPSGKDAFFLTAAALSPQDTDSSFDVYDAHVCEALSPCVTPAIATRSSCEEAPGPNPPCAGGPAPSTPPFTEPAGATTHSSGNITSKLEVLPFKTETAKTKPLTRAQKLAKALKACRKDKKKSKRLACEKLAHKKYGPIKAKAKHSAKKGG
jgi:hypothetical protein